MQHVKEFDVWRCIKSANSYKHHDTETISRHSNSSKMLKLTVLTFKRRITVLAVRRYWRSAGGVTSGTGSCSSLWAVWTLRIQIEAEVEPRRDGIDALTAAFNARQVSSLKSLASCRSTQQQRLSSEGFFTLINKRRPEGSLGRVWQDVWNQNPLCSLFF